MEKMKDTASTTVTVYDIEGILMQDEKGNYYIVQPASARIVTLAPLLAEHRGCSIHLHLSKE